ncbi:uncharacterized protein LOC127001656 [Eriocheir sinensis]|uniref:uncharacterized protein LOC127001656 n=1 Tax=Eriocheir sinensis TaxID=95602 RepID=UPI0021C57764|nr:uncharacterized protein LOC127001656 [Eriocheir sinensis]
MACNQPRQTRRATSCVRKQERRNIVTHKTNVADVEITYPRKGTKETKLGDFDKETKNITPLKQYMRNVDPEDLNIISSTHAEETFSLRQDKDTAPLKLDQEAVGTNESSSESDEPTLHDEDRVRESGFKECGELMKSEEMSETESDEEWREVMSDGQSELVESFQLTCNLSQDSTYEKEDGPNGEPREDILPRNCKEASTELDDMCCLGSELGPWSSDVPYKYTLAKKRKRHGLEAVVDGMRKAKGENIKTEKRRSIDEATLRMYIRISKKEKGVWQVIKDKRKRLYDEKANRYKLKPEEGEPHDALWRGDEDEDDDYDNEYEESDEDQQMMVRRRKVRRSYDSSLENQLLRDMKTDLVTRLQKIKKHRGAAVVSSSCLSNDPELLLTPIQDDDKEEKEKTNVDSETSRSQTPEKEQVFTRKDRGKLYKIENELEDHDLEGWFDEEVREERRRKYQQNYEMMGLAQASINFGQVNEYLREWRAGEGSIMLEPRHFVLPHKMAQHPWIKKGITREEFEKREKKRAAAAYAKWAVKSKYEKTIASVERLGRRYENIFVERLKAAMTDYWEGTDWITLDDWLRMCPLLIHGKNAKKTLFHALPQFRNSDMNVLFKSWLDICPLRDVLPLHHRICQWICLLEDPTWCVLEVISHVKVLNIIKAKRVNRITSPRPEPTRHFIKYVSADYERNLWQRFIYEVYIKGREKELKKFVISEGDWEKIQEPLLHCDRLNKIKYVDPVAKHLKVLKSFLKRGNKFCKLRSPTIRDMSSSDSNSENDNYDKETSTLEDDFLRTESVERRNVSQRK